MAHIDYGAYYLQYTFCCLEFCLKKKKNPKKYKVHIFFNLFPVYLSFFFFDPLELVLISQSPEGHAES